MKTTQSKVELVTGAAKGIGLACAEGFAKAGYITYAVKDQVSLTVTLSSSTTRSLSIDSRTKSSFTYD